MVQKGKGGGGIGGWITLAIYDIHIADLSACKSNFYFDL